MQCPIDGTTLQMTERSGIEIDYCPQCRGVWLDRGELDKMIGRDATPVQPSKPHFEESHSDSRYDHSPRHHEESRYDDHRGNKRHKKENFLGDLFDF